ncbi:hypothetical protein ADT71_05685 [Novosphingobium sp. ST904]|nr:hypothetical protein ADT71_05685 [Novosphingobium sp. ST904]
MRSAAMGLIDLQLGPTLIVIEFLHKALGHSGFFVRGKLVAERWQPRSLFLIHVLLQSSFNVPQLFLKFLGHRIQFFQLGQLDFGHRMLFVRHNGMGLALIFRYVGIEHSLLGHRMRSQQLSQFPYTPSPVLRVVSVPDLRDQPFYPLMVVEDRSKPRFGRRLHFSETTGFSACVIRRGVRDQTRRA